jgi:hypothetical protein
MAHFAKVRDGIVRNVIVADEEFINSYDDGEAGVWIQVSYNVFGGLYIDPETREAVENQEEMISEHPSRRRKNYPSVGYKYNKVLDFFYPPQPYPSFTLNNDTGLWEAPTPRPDDGKSYRWNEEELSWVEINVEGDN